MGNPLEVLEKTVDFEHFRLWLLERLRYGDGTKDGRPPFDLMSMVKALTLRTQNDLSDARMEFMLRLTSFRNAIDGVKLLVHRQRR